MPRPKLPPAEKKTQRSITLPPECWDHMDRLAESSGVSVNERIESYVRHEMGIVGFLKSRKVE